MPCLAVVRMAATGTPHALAVGGQVCVDLVVDLGHQYADGEKMYKIAPTPPRSSVISDAQKPSLNLKSKVAKQRLLSFLALMGC